MAKKRDANSPLSPDEDVLKKKGHFDIEVQHQSMRGNDVTLNELPWEMVELIVRQTGLKIWISVHKDSYTNEKLVGVERFINSITVALNRVYRTISHVCFGWLKMTQKKSFRNWLLHRIFSKMITRCRCIVIERLDIRHGFINCLQAKNVFSGEDAIEHQKKKLEDINSSMEEITSTLIDGLLVSKTKYCNFVRFLQVMEETNQHHLVNYVTSFTERKSVFGKNWPLDSGTRNTLKANHENLMKMDPFALVKMSMEKLKLFSDQDRTSDSSTKKGIHMTKSQDLRKSLKSDQQSEMNLVDILYITQCISDNQKKFILQSSELKSELINRELLRMLQNGDEKLFITITKYLNETGQHHMHSFLVTGKYPSSPMYIQNYTQCFEGCDGPTSEIEFVEYTGPCQPRDDDQSKHVPRLMNPNLTATLDMETFISKFIKQVERICSYYDREQHGEMRAVISYGTNYLKNCKVNKMTVEEYTSRVSKDQIVCKEGHGKETNVDSKSKLKEDDRIYHEFIPADDEKFDRIYKFCEDNYFTEMDTKREYRISIQMMCDSYQTYTNGDLVLNDDFSIKSFHMPDIKWLVLDLIRSKLSNNRRFDMRFKMQSVPTKSATELSEHPDCSSILKNPDKLLLRDERGNVIGIHGNYINQLNYVRYKNVRVFKYSGENDVGEDDDRRHFLRKLSIRINNEKEFSRPSTDGKFECVKENRTEVTVAIHEPEFQNPDEYECFIKNIWTFSREFGEKLE